MTTGRVSTERRGHVLLVGLDRPAKRNAFDLPLWDSLCLAYGELERDDDLRAGVLFAHGDHFTGGLDLAEVGPRVADGTLDWADDMRDPWRNDGEPYGKPVVAAGHGWCMTLGIGLLAAADV